MRYRKANPIGIELIVKALVGNMGMGQDILLRKLKACWNDIVGATNARNTRPDSLEDGILSVAVSSPIWITQARFHKQHFLKNIRESEPDAGNDIRDIRFFLDRY
ncbi:MAG: DUF721 domain-containing protein [Candidatus Latescibacteria bacterium]|nr:DUF721 domain-containing protein [Candidatus Latescibacterota bacterium]